MSESKYYGIYQGIVTNTKDPEKRGRIKILCPEVLDDKVESAWCDPCVPVAYDNGGDFCIPQVDEAVWVMFIGGDSNLPVYLGGWWQKNKSPFGSTYSGAEKTRIISYADCTIVLIDGKISINIGGGSTELVIEDKKITVTGKSTFNGDTIFNGNVTLNGNMTVNGSIKVKQTVTTRYGTPEEATY